MKRAKVLRRSESFLSIKKREDIPLSSEAVRFNELGFVNDGATPFAEGLPNSDDEFNGE